MRIERAISYHRLLYFVMFVKSYGTGKFQYQYEESCNEFVQGKIQVAALFCSGFCLVRVQLDGEQSGGRG
jgi:hypothetical protein